MEGKRLSQDDRRVILAMQGGTCAGCNDEHTFYVRLVLDHCHERGHVRGLLCPGCNWLLGRVKDDPQTLRSMAAEKPSDPRFERLARYLEREPLALPDGPLYRKLAVDGSGLDRGRLGRVSNVRTTRARGG